MYKTRPALTYSLVSIVGFLTVCPVIMLIFGSFSKGLGAFGTFTLEKYIQAYTDPGICRGDRQHRDFRPGILAGGDGPGAFPFLSEQPHRYPLQIPVQDHLSDSHDDPPYPFFRELGAAAQPVQRQ